MNAWVIPLVFSFLSLFILSEAQIKLWNFSKTKKNDRHKQLLDYFVGMLTFTNNTEFINLNRKIGSTITSQKQMFTSGENVQLICENSLLRLLKENIVDSKTFSNEMSVLRESIGIWNKSFKLLQESDEVRTFREFMFFLDYIDSKKFEIDFCIRLLNNLQHPPDIINDKDSLKRKEELCIKLRQEIEYFISKKLSCHSSGVLKQCNKCINEIFKTATGSIYNELDQLINQINKYSKMFNIILLLEELKRNLGKSRELKPYLNLKDFVDNVSFKMIDENTLSNIIIELHEYLPEGTVFVSSPLSRTVLIELNIAKKQLESLNGCSKYEHIMVPLKKKLIYIMKSIANVLVSYEKSFKALRGVLKNVSYINLVFDKNVVDLCSYDFEKDKKELYSLSLLDDLLSDKNLNNQSSNKAELHIREIGKQSQYSKTKSGSGNLLENRNIKGLPFLPDSKENDVLREKFSDKLSVEEIRKLVQQINSLTDEIDRTYIYISNSTNIMLNSLEKLQFTNKVYLEIIESSTGDESIPKSLYSYSYLLYLDITMSIKKNSYKMKKQASDIKKQIENALTSVDIKPNLRSEIGEASEEAINKILNIIVSLRQTVHERTQGSGLKNIKARLPTTKKRLYKEVLSPLKCIEDHLLNLKRSNEDVMNKMANIEKQMKQIQKNKEIPVSSSNIIEKLEKYIKPLNYIMKCSVIKETSEHYEDCRHIISQAPHLLKHVHSLIKENNKTILNKKDIYNKSNAKLEALSKEWNRHLNWVRDIPRICNDQLSTMNKLDSNMRMILG